MKKFSTKSICLLGIGIALYVALSLCVQVPVFENYYICLGYIVMLVYCYSFGPIAGSIVGGLGCLLHCILINGLRGMPGWFIGNVFIGLLFGYIFNKTKFINNKFFKYVIEAIVIVFGTAVAILLIKSGVECLLYGQPMILRLAKNTYAFIADVVVLCLSLPMSVYLDKLAIRMNLK